MLQQVKGNPSGFIECHNLAVYERIERERFARSGNMRELVGEEISSPRPKRDFG